MIKIVNNNVSFKPEAADKCELCGETSELRPYGPNRERICYDCGQKDKATTERMMSQDLDNMLASVGLTLPEANLIDPDPFESLLLRIPSGEEKTMIFNKLDICAAYYLYGSNYHSGQGSKEYAYMGRAMNAGFKPGLSFSYASLSDNGKAIYAKLVGNNQLFS